MGIGGRIRAARKALGMTQEELARRAGMSLKGMGDIERGAIPDPHYSSLNKIAEGLGVSVGELLGEPVLSSGKAEAPTQTGQEEERRVRAFLAAHPSEEERVQALEKTASIIGFYNDRWRSEVDEIEERGILPYGRSIEMRALLTFVSDAMTHKGIRDYVEGVGVEASDKEKTAIIRLQEAWVEMFNLANRMREVERAIERANRESIDEVERTIREPINQDYIERGIEQLEDHLSEVVKDAQKRHTELSEAFEEAEKRHTEERPQW